jgi:hypothetical protein
MTDRITVFGYGPVGRATTARLMAEGREVIVAQRNAPSDLPKGATFAPADALDRDAVTEAVRGSGQFVVAIGFSYSGVVWRDVWPRVMPISSPPAGRPARGWCSWTICTCTGPRQRRSSRRWRFPAMV